VKTTHRLSEEILTWITSQRRIVYSPEVHTQFPGTTRGTIDQNLTRMVSRGFLDRPYRGCYTVPSAAPVTSKENPS
jgi:predicted transcriptional regulator of viral defense system